MNSDPSPASLPTPFNPPGPKRSRSRRFWAFPVTRIVLYLLVFTALALASSLVLGGVLYLLHHRHGHNRELLMLAGEGLAAASAVPAFWVMTRFADKRPWSTAGWTRRGMAQGLLGGAAIGTAMLSVSVGILRLLGLYHVTAVTPSVLLLVPLPLYFFVAVFEETLFRGYLFQTLEGHWGSGVALAVSSLLFGLAHLANHVPGETGLQRLAGPITICLEAGLPLGAAYLLSRRWWLPIGLHWAWDYFEGPIYGCPDSGTHDPHTLLHASFSGPALLTGGVFGPEAGVVLLAVGTVAGALLLRAAIKRGQWRPLPRRAS